LTHCQKDKEETEKRKEETQKAKEETQKRKEETKLDARFENRLLPHLFLPRAEMLSFSEGQGKDEYYLLIPGKII
jgi:hypothetical protein